MLEYLGLRHKYQFFCLQGPGWIEVDEIDLEEAETCCPIHEVEDQEEGTDHLLDRGGVVWGEHEGELDELKDVTQEAWEESEGELNVLREVRQGVWGQLEGLREEGWATEWEAVSAEEVLPQW